HVLRALRKGAFSSEGSWIGGGSSTILKIAAKALEASMPDLQPIAEASDLEFVQSIDWVWWNTSRLPWHLNSYAIEPILAWQPVQVAANFLGAAAPATAIGTFTGKIAAA